jgi:hypothetical protein
VRGAELHVKPLGRAGGLGISPGSCLIYTGVAVLALWFAPGLQAGRTGASITETTQPKNDDRWASAEWQTPDSRGLHLASWETEAVFESATERKNWQAEFATSSIDRNTSPEYLETDSRDERFTGAVDTRVGRQYTAPHHPPSSDRDGRVGAERAVGRSERGSAPFPALPPAANNPLRVADASAQEDSSLLSDAAARIAICDIAAHRVYLPNGQRLEAHSGLGKYRDDPRRRPPISRAAPALMVFPARL